MVERLEGELEKAAAEGVSAEASLPKLVSLLGAGNEEGKAVLAALGWQMTKVADAAPVWRKAKPRRQPPRKDNKPAPVNPNSPFARLAQLVK